MEGEFGKDLDILDNSRIKMLKPKQAIINIRKMYILDWTFIDYNVDFSANLSIKAKLMPVK